MQTGPYLAHVLLVLLGVFKEKKKAYILKIVCNVLHDFPIFNDFHLIE